MTNKYNLLNVISLFSGAGGLDYGFEAAGYNTVFSNDFDKYSCNTLRLNGCKNVFECPIDEISSKSVIDSTGISKGNFDALVGGPPCQPFSKSAYWTKGDTLRLSDPRANTLTHYFRLVEELQPRVFLLENVHGLNYSGKEEGFQFILKRIQEINIKQGSNYRPFWKVINVADYGVPQLRVRFFLIASRDGAEFNFPVPTCTANSSTNKSFLDVKQLENHVSTWEAIGSLSLDKSQKLDVGGKWGDLLPSIPEGENYLWHTDRKDGLPLFGWRTRYWCFLLKLAKNQPSWTIQAQPGSAIGPFHWENRKLSWQEMAAIQTFPKHFIIEGPRAEIQRQLGNAVPSLMAEILANEIATQLLHTGQKRSLTLKVDRKNKIPKPELVKSVPEKYLHLVGVHKAHPGTGKGPMSFKRKNSDANEEQI
jgi:DNA (cytosine-5)-methyltransferase 1